MIPILDTAGYQLPGFSQSLPGNGMPTDKPLTMSWTQPLWRPDLNKALARGVKGIIHRASNAETIDPTYKAVAETAARVGLPHGGYGYLRNDRIGPVEGARVFLRALDAAAPWKIKPMADVENFTGQEKYTPRAKADYIHAWMTTVGDAVGVTPILYGPAWWFDANIGQAIAKEFDRYDFMLSHYIHGNAKAPVNATDWYGWASSTQGGDPGVAWGRAPAGVTSREGWQFTSTGAGPEYGFASSWIDCNVIVPEVWDRWLTEPTPPPEAPVLYPVGYEKKEVTYEQLVAMFSPGMEPEYARRFFNWIRSLDGKIGIGSGLRTSQPTGPGFAPAGKSFHLKQAFRDGTVWFSAVDLNTRTSGGHSSGAIKVADVPLQGSAEAAKWGVHINVGTPNNSGFEVWHMQAVEMDGYDSWVSAGRHRPKPGYDIPDKGDKPPVIVPPAVAYVPVPPMPVLIPSGDHPQQGWSVEVLQLTVNRYNAQGRGRPQIPITGVYDLQTIARVMDFQADKGLLVDQIVGPKTWTALFTPLPVLVPIAGTGATTGWPVEILQETLNRYNAQGRNRPVLVVDGRYGIQTIARIAEFQADKGLKVDNIVGPVTWDRLLNG